MDSTLPNDLGPGRWELGSLHVKAAREAQERQKDAENALLDNQLKNGARLMEAIDVAYDLLFNWAKKPDAAAARSAWLNLHECGVTPMPSDSWELMHSRQFMLDLLKDHF
jgi:hypothetical protein